MYVAHVLISNFVHDLLHTSFQRPFQCGSYVHASSISASLLIGQVWPSAPYRRIGNGLITSMSCSTSLLNLCNKKSAQALGDQQGACVHLLVARFSYVLHKLQVGEF